MKKSAAVLVRSSRAFLFICPFTELNDDVDIYLEQAKNYTAEVYRREQKLKEQVQVLKIEIDNARRNQEVAEITETEYFQNLQEQAKAMRRRNQE